MAADRADVVKELATMVTPQEFKRYGAPSEDSSVCEWICRLPSGLELLAIGDDSAPSGVAIDRLNMSLEAVADLEAKAIRFIKLFLKDEGRWSLQGIHCSLKAQREGNDFLLSFTFESERDPMAYAYNWFEVGFDVPRLGPAADRKGRPAKFIAEFY